MSKKSNLGDSPPSFPFRYQSLNRLHNWLENKNLLLVRFFPAVAAGSTLGSVATLFSMAIFLLVMLVDPSSTSGLIAYPLIILIVLAAGSGVIIGLTAQLLLKLFRVKDSAQNKLITGLTLAIPLLITALFVAIHYFKLILSDYQPLS